MNNTPGTPARPPRASFRKWLLGTVAAVALVVVFAPQLVALSPWFSSLAQSKMPGFQGELRIGSASLSWWAPSRFDNIELAGTDGEVFLTIDRLTDERTAFAAVFEPHAPSSVRVEKPVFVVKLRDDGSNVEDALRPMLEQQPPSKRERRVEIADGTCRVSRDGSERVVEWHEIAGNVHVAPQDRGQSELTFSARLAEARTSPPVQVEAEWTGRADDLDLTARLSAGDLPLVTLQPALARLAPDLELSGSLTAQTELKLTRTPGSGAPPRAAISGKLSLVDMQVASASRLGDDRPEVRDVEIDVDATLADSIVHVNRLSIQSDFASLNARGNVPVDPHAGLSPEQVDFELTGEVDLVRLAGLLPGTLHLRKEATLTEGKVHLAANSRVENGQPHWQAHLNSTRLAASVSGEAVAWDQPIQVSADIRRGDRLFFDRLTCESDLIQLSGEGTSDQLRLTGGCDLDQIAGRLGKIVDLGGKEFQGHVTATLDLARRDSEPLEIALATTVDNLQIRRLTTRMVERRRGDLEDVGRDAPPVAIPEGPPRGVRVDPRMRREMNKARRDALRESRQQEREIRQKAAETVMVPVTEWETLWNEPRLTVSVETRLASSREQIELTKLEALAEGLRLTARGTLSDVSNSATIDLRGESEYDVAQLVSRLPDRIASHLEMQGKERREFTLRGPLRGEFKSPIDPSRPAAVSPDLKGTAGGGWEAGNVFGLQAGAGAIDLSLEQAIVRMRPLEIDLSGGKLRLNSRVLLDRQPMLLELPAGKLVDNVALSQEVCDAWLSYIAPILAEATRVEGRFSVELGDTQLPLADPGSGKLQGRFDIAEAQVLPGPLFDGLGAIIGRVESAITLAPPRDLLGLDRPLVQIQNQTIDFELRDRRLYHNGAGFNVRKVFMQTRGSVGLDQSLDLIASVSFPSEWARSIPFLASLEGKGLEFPIRGTLHRPQVDASGIGRMFEEMGQGALDSLLNGGLRRLIDR